METICLTTPVSPPRESPPNVILPTAAFDNVGKTNVSITNIKIIIIPLHKITFFLGFFFSTYGITKNKRIIGIYTAFDAQPITNSKTVKIYVHELYSLSG